MSHETFSALITSHPAFEEAETHEAELITYEAKLTEAHALRNMNWSKPQVKQAIIEESNLIFINSHPHLRRENEAEKMYPGVVAPVTPGSG